MLRNKESTKSRTTAMSGGAMSELSRKVVAVGHDNEFGIKRMASVGRKFVPFPIRCSIVGAGQTFRELIQKRR